MLRSLRAKPKVLALPLSRLWRATVRESSLRRYADSDETRRVRRLSSSAKKARAISAVPLP